ncbi:hypothetical protein ACMGEE_12280 [Erwinia sp. DT-104]|uniref:hypothetical protein n=1 Tax=Erwinia sp. DT-104 TaxID=3396161 RepID=UPI003F1DFD6E
MNQSVQDGGFIHYATLPSTENINCFMATLECYAQHNQLADNFSLSHFEHEFYLKNIESNAFTPTHSSFGIDTAWGCNDSLEMMTDRVVNRIRERCGVAISLEMVFDATGLIQRLHHMGDHAICIFDPFYLPESVNYGIRHSLSVCIVNGYAEKTEKFGLLERKQGQSYVAETELKKSADYFIRSKGSCHLFHLAKIPPVVALAEIDIKADLERILTHFYSSESHAGLAALDKFQQRYPELLSFDRAFIIPWAERCFGERYANARFLQALLDGGHPAAQAQPSCFKELIEIYNKTGDLWRSFEVFHLYSVSQGKPAILQRNLTLIADIVENEKRCVQLLERLRESLH